MMPVTGSAGAPKPVDAPRTRLSALNVQPREERSRQSIRRAPTDRVLVLRCCRGELDRGEIERLKRFAYPQSGSLPSSDESPRLVIMTANRDELIHLIEGLPDDQVEVVLADVRRLASDRPRGDWPPAFFGAGVAKEGRPDVARNVDKYLAEGFGRRRS